MRPPLASVSVIGILSGLPGLVNADAGWTNPAAVSEINQQPVGGVGSTLVFIEAAGVTTNPSDCSHTTGFYFDVSDERKKRLFALLLSAHMAGKPVRFYTTGVCHSPWGYAELDGLIIQ